MLDKLKVVENRYLELSDMTTRPDFYDDPRQAAMLLKEQRELEAVVEAYRRYLGTKQTIDVLLEMLSEPQEPEMKELCQEELNEAKAL